MSTMTRSLLLCLLVISSGVLLFGQAGATGTILGTVTDNSGAVVANAKVAITNMATGVVKRSTASSSGDFNFPYLQPGSYRVEVEAQGFEKSVVQNIGLVVAQEARANVTLKPGSISESVTVEANAVALDTDSSTVSQTVTQQQVNELPLNGRNFLSLLFIGAGAVETNGEMGQMREGEGNAISINGSRPESSNYTLDGLANTDTALNTPAVILSQDAIQEFKIQSETYSAEYGFSANQINIVSKSGTNQLHGSIFEFDRNDDFDAKAPFQTAIPELRQNQFGFVVGGPVYIPKVYDGRNHTFWLVNYEGWRIRNGTNLFFSAPDATELGGNFSAENLPAYGTAACTAALTNDLPCMPVDPTTGAAFPGNSIPTTSFSRLAATELGAGLFPAPNCIGCPQGNYRLNTTLPNTVNQETYKLDETLGRWGSVFFRYTNSNYANDGISGSVSVPAGVSIFSEKSTSWEVSHTISLGHNIINNFRFGRLEAIANQGGNPAPTAGVSALGLSGTFQNIPAAYRLWPTIAFQSLTAAYGSQANDSTTSDIPMWEFADSISTVRGKHTLTAGFDFRKWVQKRDLSADYLGDFTYDNTTVQNNGGGCTTASGLCGTGNQVADFLLGYYNNASTFQPGPFTPAGETGNLNQYHFLYVAPFFQDDWKVNSRLSLNLGLRWDYRSVPFEASNKMFWFDVNQPGGGLCYADQSLGTQTISALGGPIAPSGNGFYDYCGRHNPADGSKKPFAPRIGFAYRFGDKTVLRGGYGLFFDSSETREIDDSGDIYPFVVRASPNPTTDPTLPKLTDNMFPPVTLHQISPATDGSQFFAVIISEKPRNPYVQQWSLSLQHELARNTTLEVNYVGNKGTHLLDRTNIGQPLPPSDPALCASTGGLGGNCPVADRRPYANITSANGFLDSEWDGYSNYNAGNIKFEKRTKSMAFLTVYTWAKSLDDKSAAAGLGATNAFAGHMDEHDPRLDYGPSDFDVPQRFVASYVYQLPIGRGKRYASGMNKAADAAVGGWELTGVTTFQKGFPFSVLCNDTLGLLITFTQRCNQVGDPGSPHGINDWFNTASFVQPLPGQFGDVGRNTLREPGINNWDMGLDKTFDFTERLHFQVRLETFNTFNHADYGLDPSQAGVTPGQSAVGNSITGPGFGTVTLARPGRIVQLGGKITF
ncbi:MAG: TonB-dependent receptor [Candidatus Sulfotelmatobacter sp.]